MKKKSIISHNYMCGHCKYAYTFKWMMILHFLVRHYKLPAMKKVMKQ